MEREKINSLMEKVCGRMLHLSNTSVDETCPIGIIDFDKWEWPQGVGLYGMYKHYKKSGAKEYLQYIISWFEERIAEGVPERNVNTTAPMLTMAFVAEETKDERMLAMCREWAEWVMNEMPRTEEGGLQHIVSGEENRQQLWDDTLFMTVLFLAKMGAMENREDYKEEACYQFLLHIKYLANAETGLWYHGWTFEGRHNFAKAFWARGNCWITAGIPELIEILGLGGYLKRYLTGVLTNQVEALKKLQVPSGMWHTLLDEEESYEETSAAAGFAYGILKGVHMGLLDEEYLAVAEKAVEGIVEQIDEDGTVNQVSYGTGMGSDLQHYRDIPTCPMAYGQSLVIMMLGEI
ncbi:glycoside hydrolase 105 family protein [Lachnoclostridium sp. An169]|uniref:beta-galactosidase BglB n=1 Tax=Lachnoclostridium sp. An169 TaxID=1965569 RepID=UPI000B385351|nr:glycoside hydrolase family 88 protein [Lachnoclostridium sp. An169]OUP81258.1 glycoside hydrolase 105 family protein [Lachnoclostridium sp. An169]